MDERTDSLLKLADEFGARRAKSTEAIGRNVARRFRTDLGESIGQINAFSGLRTGRTEATLGRLQDRFTDIIGNFAVQASGEGIGDALRARGQLFQEEEAARNRKGGLLGGIGKLVARGALGAITGGPLGALGTIVTGEIGDRTGEDRQRADPKKVSDFIRGRTRFE